MLVELLPEGARLKRVFADEQRAVALKDAIDDETIGGQVSVRTRVAVAGETVVGLDGDTGRSPVGERVRAVGDATACDWGVEDKRGEVDDLHSAEIREKRSERVYEMRLYEDCAGEEMAAG